MTRIALVSVTLNAVNPMTEYLQERDAQVQAVNYLDSYLLEKVRKEGGIRDDSMRRMFAMLSQACADGADGVLLTCTVFSPYAEYFSRLLSKPVVCPDKAMLEQAAARGGRTAILCTFQGTVDTTRALYQSCCRAQGREESVDMIVVDGAYEAANAADFETHNRLIREKALELDGQYDQLILAQISMAQAARGLSLQHARIYTSPESAYETIMREIAEAEKTLHGV